MSSGQWNHFGMPPLTSSADTWHVYYNIVSWCTCTSPVTRTMSDTVSTFCLHVCTLTPSHTGTNDQWVTVNNDRWKNEIIMENCVHTRVHSHSHTQHMQLSLTADPTRLTSWGTGPCVGLRFSTVLWESCPLPGGWVPTQGNESITII